MILEDKEIKLILSVFYSKEEWNAMLSTSLVKKLNTLSETDIWMLYSENETIYAESKNDLVILNNNVGKNTLTQKKKRILNSCAVYTISNLKQKWENTTVNMNIVYYNMFNNSTSLSYNSSFIVNNTYNVILDMSNCKVSQNNKPICWAATIIRYINGNSTLTAEQVCKDINHSETGGELTDVIKALKKYNITYKAINSQLTLTKIRHNLVNKKPICLGASSSGKHMVTIYGALSNYDTPSKYLNIWNSGDNSSATITYSNNLTTMFQYDNINWTWITTVAAYE